MRLVSELSATVLTLFAQGGGQTARFARRCSAGGALCLVILLAAPFDGGAAVTISWTAIGNPANVADSTGFGSVAYPYNIGTDDVTNSQYVDFLNTKDPNGANLLGLFNSNMSNANVGGITYNDAAPSGSKYVVVDGRQNHPVNYVNWYDAVRFANWLNNGQGSGDTETGAYTILGGTPIPSNASSIARNPSATVFLSSENEWYKAAYYSPASHSYFAYPTASNAPPAATAPPGVANSANYALFAGAPTDVGAYTLSASPYGTFDQGGNVYQWNETLSNTIFRGIRGGSFSSSNVNSLASTSWSGVFPTNIIPTIGFRVASISPLPLPGDANFDHTVNGLDLALVASNWLHLGFHTTGDANGDGTVNGLDISLIASHWLQSANASASVSSVPEPGSALLLVLGGLALLVLAPCASAKVRRN